ncbi:SF3B5 factor, partial [Polypterus senegalus]
MNNKKFVHFLHFVLDYSTILSKCSINFLYDTLKNILQTNLLVESTSSCFLSLRTKLGEYHKALETKFTVGDNCSICCCGTPLTKSQQPARRSESTGKGTLGAEFHKIIDNTVKYMDVRFQNLSEKPLLCQIVVPFTPVSSLTMTDRYTIHSQLEHLQSKYIGTGHADTTKWEWLVNQHRDSYCSYMGHFDLLNYFAIAENESKARVRFNLMEKMLQPCGPPADKPDDV